MTWIKVCGITNLDDARTAVDAGADALGFVFCKDSPRSVDVHAAQQIAGKLPAMVEKVGVFVNERPDMVVETTLRAGLTAAQIYGTSNFPRLLAELPQGDQLRWILAFPANRFSDSDLSLCERWKPHLMATLVDSGSATRPGGTGIPFEWKKMCDTLTALGRSVPIVVAGGLTAENVSEAIGILNPWGVDVSSGVEAVPGRKDPEKIRNFIQAVRSSERVQK
jgi:phosphoribosylanthranilate isomerase